MKMTMTQVTMLTITIIKHELDGIYTIAPGT